MAEIEIQKKRGAPWGWIIGVLVLALLLWGVVEMLDDDADTAEMEAITEPAAMTVPAAGDVGSAVPQAVTTFESECVQAPDAPQTDMGAGHTYTVTCLQHIAASLESIIQRDRLQETNVSQQLESYRSTLQQLQASDSTSGDHTNLTRQAALSAAELMEAARNAWRGTNAELQSAVAETRQAAQALKTDAALLEQRDQMRAFFREAGEALRGMATAQPGV
ncbi:MAG TPA: hypothetical protein VFZ51_00605 [Woeseiaceae bacterium]